MDGKVDLLAVMDEAALSQAIRGDREDMRAAIAAVAELIEADVEYDESKAAAAGFAEDAYEVDSYGVYGSEFDRCLACYAESGAGVLNKGVTHEPSCVRGRYEAAIQRRAAALAAVRAPAKESGDER